MRTIYIDSDYKCHLVNDGTMTAVEMDFFDGKCDAFVEGYLFVPSGETWTRLDGEVFHGELIAPWKNYNELDRAQQDYEKQQLEEYKNIVAEQDLLILDLQYNTLIKD